MKVARYDYGAQFPDLEALMARLRTLIVQGHYVMSGEVPEFEAALAAYLEVPHAFGTNCGTDALLLALHALGVGPGDEVLTQANTFHATVNAICRVGAIPVLVDADERTFNLDPRQLPAAVTPRTRVLLPVHLFGKPAPMGPVLELAAAHGLYVVEDAAQAIGARWRGRRVASLGDLGCFSFHPSKNLAAAGDGGAVVTRHAGLVGGLELWRYFGQSQPNVHDLVGLNSKLDSLQAVILQSKLPWMDRWNVGRRAAAAAYRERLAGLPLALQAEEPDEEHVYHLFQVRTPARDALLAALRAAGIDAVVRWPIPIPLQAAFADRGWRRGQFPVAERLAEELLCLPIRPDLPLDEIEFVCERVRAFFGGA
jgi:dTDP-4-amino-4,6-dideoxygalactose transaminase